MHTPNPQLRARERGGKRESGNRRALSRGGGWGGQERRRAAEERGQAEGGRIRVGVVKKKSKGEVVGWEGKRGRESTQTATLIQDHWQLYFKGNSQNCDTALHNCREPILFLDAMPKMIKGMVRKGPHLNKRSQRKMPLLSGVPLHTSTKTHHSPNKSFTTLHNQVRSIWSNTVMHTIQHLQSHMYPSSQDSAQYVIYSTVLNQSISIRKDKSVLGVFLKLKTVHIMSINTKACLTCMMLNRTR